MNTQVRAPIRIGVLGCAAVNEYALMQPASSDTGIAVTAIASRDPKKAGEFAQRHGIKETYTYEELLSADLDAIYVPLPNSMHCEWTIRALQSGKAVLCEKPLASNATEAQRMVDAAAEAKIPLVEAFHWRYHPLAIRMAEIVSSGVLGELQRVDVRFLIPWAYLGKDDIRLKYELAGGSTMDAGSYCINFLRLLLSEPERVLSAQAILAGSQIDSQMRGQLAFSHGRIGNFECAYDGKLSEMDCGAEIYGSRGSLHVSRPFIPHLGNSLGLTIDGSSKRETLTTTPSYVFQAREFADVVRYATPSRTPASDGVLNMRALDSVYLAAGLQVRGSAR